MTRRRRWRAAVLARDRGICAACGMDTIGKRAEVLVRLVDLPPAGQVELRLRLRTVGFPLSRACWWEADHVQAIHAGGADDLANLQTLCLGCHADKTRTDAAAHPRWRRAKRGPTRRDRWLTRRGLCLGSGRRPIVRGFAEEVRCRACDARWSTATSGAPPSLRRRMWGSRVVPPHEPEALAA